MRTLNQAAQNIVDQLILTSNGLYDAPVIHAGDSVNTLSISWDGPCNWTMNDGYGEFEEVASELAAMGITPKYTEKNYWIDPAGYGTEPYNYYTLVVYKD